VDFCTRITPLRPVAALAVGLAFAAIGPAAALPTCDGSFAASLLQPLPTPMVVGLDIPDDSPANLRMAARFLAGLGEAGVAVGAHPNVLLHVSYRESGSGLADQGEQEFSDPADTGGGIEYTEPKVSGSLFTGQGRPERALLSLRVEATEGQTTRTSWVASVQCRIIGTDDGQLAQDLGRAIGAALGKRLERGPL